MMDVVKNIITPQIWEGMVRQVYINSLLSWIGLIPTLVLVFWLYKSWDKILDGEEIPIIILVCLSTAAFFGGIIWLVNGFDFLNPTYHANINLAQRLASLIK